MKSMTGYGKGEAENADKKITIELKAVNNRYLEINSRISKSFSFADDIIKKCIQDKIKRGTVDVILSYSVTGRSGKVVETDYSLASEYVNAAAELSSKYGIANDFSVSSLIRMPDLLSVSSAPDNIDELTALFAAATKNAAIELDKMRETEGESIKQDFKKLVGNITDGLKKAEQRAPLVVNEYKEKLKKRIAELTEGVSVDDARMAAEVAFFADRSDINEELSRLTSHIEQFLATLESDETQGRRLDFLSQEMNREINTMGSKANDLTLTKIVIEMKNELEKIKEQIRNVE